MSCLAGCVRWSEEIRYIGVNAREYSPLLLINKCRLSAAAISFNYPAGVFANPARPLAILCVLTVHALADVRRSFF